METASCEMPVRTIEGMLAQRMLSTVPKIDPAIMAELITEEQPRIKYQTHCDGTIHGLQESNGVLRDLAALMHELELLGATPILNDGLVAGNCGLRLAYAGTAGVALHGIPAAGAGPAQAAALEDLVLVSRSGKPPGHVLQGHADFCAVSRFDRAAWAAHFYAPAGAAAAQGAPSSSQGAAAAATAGAGGSTPAAAAAAAAASQPATAPAPAAPAGVRPSSDSPLLFAALAPGAAERYGWQAQPLVAVHGHALAEGPGLAYARDRGIPVSELETMFSTPPDLDQLEALFKQHPYPATRCYIRKGHGFFILGQSVAEAAATCEQLVRPFMVGGPGGGR